MIRFIWGTPRGFEGEQFSLCQWKTKNDHVVQLRKVSAWSLWGELHRPPDRAQDSAQLLLNQIQTTTFRQHRSSSEMAPGIGPIAQWDTFGRRLLVFATLGCHGKGPWQRQSLQAARPIPTFQVG